MQAGIIYQNINGSKFLKHRCEHPLDIFLHGNIRVEGQRPAAGLADFCRDRFGRFFISDVINHNIRSRGSQGQGNAFADTGIGAGYQGFLALQMFGQLASRHNHFRQILRFF